jgi:predicted ATPase
VAELGQIEAMTLFLDRARSVAPSFKLTEENTMAVSRICRPDGMPLMIELATARANLLTPQHIADRLDDRIALESGKAR